MGMIKINLSIVLISFVVGWILLPKSSMAEPVPVFAKDPGKVVDYSKAEGVELVLSKIRKDYYEINVSAPNTDSADCYCPYFMIRPISQMKLFTVIPEENWQCEDTVLISKQGCGLRIHSGVALGEWIKQAPEIFVYKNGVLDTNIFYIDGGNVEIPDSNGVAFSHSGEYPVYALSGKIDTLDITFSLKQDCVVGSLKAKTKLFRIRGLTMRLVIDQRKGFPVISKVP